MSEFVYLGRPLTDVRAVIDGDDCTISGYNPEGELRAFPMDITHSERFIEEHIEDSDAEVVHVG